VKSYLGFIDTQPLWKQEQFGIPQFRLPTFNLDSFSPIPIPTNLRLGHQVEYVFLELLKQHPDYKILAHSIQVKKGNTTIGELDFLLEFKKVIYHIELSYKFYIIDPSISEPIHRLMGPNRKDMFFTKLEKTKHKQLPLLFSEECVPYMKELNIDPKTIVQQVIFIGQLFTPITGENPSIRPLNKKCIVGTWMRMKDLEQYSFSQSVYYIPQKREWLHKPHDKVSWQSHFDILMEVNIRLIAQNAPMVWRKLTDGSIDKFFVVWW